MACVAGCSPGPEINAVREADIGNYPNDYEAILTKTIGSTLKDPYSAIFTFSRGPSKGGVRDMHGRVSDYDFFGWVVCGTVNAKNSYGGYVGAVPFVAVIRYGKVTYRDMGSAGRNVCSNNIKWATAVAPGLRHAHAEVFIKDAGLPEQADAMFRDRVFLG